MTCSAKWCFTINAKDGQIHPDAPIMHESFNYLLYQLERGEADGRLHYQGCLARAQKSSLAQVKRELGVEHAHLEACRNWAKAVAYCKKEETRVEGPWEFGELPRPGRRTDLDACIEKVKPGTTMAALADEHPKQVVIFGRGLQTLIALKNPPRRRENLKVYCLWGESGVGKTHAAWDLFPDLYQVADTEVPWFDGYQDQKVALLEEYGPGKMSINYLKQVLDKYPLRVRVKGGMVPWNPEIIILTSNTHPENWYPTSGPRAVNAADLMALLRRMECHHFLTRGDAEAWTHRMRKRQREEQDGPGGERHDAVDVDGEDDEVTETLSQMTQLCEELGQNPSLEIESPVQAPPRQRVRMGGVTVLLSDTDE